MSVIAIVFSRYKSNNNRFMQIDNLHEDILQCGSLGEVDKRNGLALESSNKAVQGRDVI